MLPNLASLATARQRTAAIFVACGKVLSLCHYMVILSPNTEASGGLGLCLHG